MWMSRLSLYSMTKCLRVHKTVADVLNQFAEKLSYQYGILSISFIVYSFLKVSAANISLFFAFTKYFWSIFVSVCVCFSQLFDVTNNWWHVSGSKFEKKMNRIICSTDRLYAYDWYCVHVWYLLAFIFICCLQLMFVQLISIKIN